MVPARATGLRAGLPFDQRASRRLVERPVRASTIPIASHCSTSATICNDPSAVMDQSP
jgi:hypothetical protein